MSCNCTGSLESKNAALKEKLAAIAAAWQKLAPQLWVEEPDVAFTEALEAMHAAVRGEVERQQSEMAALKAENDALKAALEREKQTWRCFECGFETADTQEALAHFGDRDDAEEFKPLCKWWKSMSAEERADVFQGTIQELNAERDENAALFQKVEGLQYRIDSVEAEIASRFKGCRTINEAWCQFDSMEGRALAAEEQRDELRAALGEAVKEISLFLSGLAPAYSGHLCTDTDRRKLEKLLFLLRSMHCPNCDGSGIAITSTEDGSEFTCQCTCRSLLARLRPLLAPNSAEPQAKCSFSVGDWVTHVTDSWEIAQQVSEVRDTGEFAKEPIVFFASGGFWRASRLKLAPNSAEGQTK